MEQAKYDIKHIEELAESLIDTDSIELIMEMPQGYLKQAMADRTPEGLAVLRQRMIVVAKIRKFTIDLALGGSAPAMIQAEQYIKQIHISEI